MRLTACSTQSVGGGGGDGGGSLAVVLGKHDGAANLAIAIGGSGEGGGNANNVTSANSGTVVTAGNKAHGIVAQSVGGGGGDGGFSASGVVAKGTNTRDLSVSVGGSAAEGGDAGTVKRHQQRQRVYAGPRGRRHRRAKPGRRRRR